MSDLNGNFDEATVDDRVWQFGQDKLGHLVSKHVFCEMVALRRKLHECPELAFKETKTAAVVREELGSISGVRVLQTPVGGTGVIGVIEGQKSGGKTILFRADLDGLPIPEVLSGGDALPEPEAKRRKVSGTKNYCCGLCGSPFEPVSAAGKANVLRGRIWHKRCISKNEGVSHSCGHDGHIAMLIGAAKVLAERRETLCGSVVLLFQPAEERHSVNNPMGGAIRMIRDAKAGEELCLMLGAPPKSLSQDSKWTTDELYFTDGYDTGMDGRLLECVDEVYGAHLWNYSSAGNIGCAPGSVTANSDSLEITVCGPGGHASSPQGTVDVIVVAAQFINAVQCIVSRNTSPTESCVITFGKIDGGVAPNVIATSVKILGTVRTYNMPIKRMVKRRLEEIAKGVAASHGPSCSIAVKFLDGYPACVNHPSCAEAVLCVGKNLLGDRLAGPPSPNMAGEDFSFFLHRKPGAFFFVGSNPDAEFILDPSVVEEEEYEHGTKKTIFHHTPEFDIHEGSLWCGAAMWVALAMRQLSDVRCGL